MEIRRYINGKPISREALVNLRMKTPELEHAVKDARRRAEALMSEGKNSVGITVTETRADG